MKKSHAIILVFALIKFAIPFVFINSQFELHRDEYLYLADGRHLAWGFIEMPPLLALLGRISLILFDHTAFGVHIWGSLFGALTVLVIGKLVLQLKGNNYALFLACLGFLLAGFLRMHILFQPNFLDVFFWTLSSYLVVCWIDSDDKKYLYYLGLCFGLGMLSKYTMAFYILGFWIAVLCTSKRTWLTNKHFYLAMLLALGIALPNFIWQVSHHFPVMHHMKLLESQQLQYLSRLDFLLFQILDALPCFFIWIIGLAWLIFWRQGQRYVALAIIYFVILAILLLFNGKHYYAMSIYPTLIAVGAVVLENLTRQRNRQVWRWIMPVLMLVLSIPFFPLALPLAGPTELEKIYKTLHVAESGALRWEDGKDHPLPQDFSDMLGWKEMALKVNKAWQMLDSSEKAHTLLFCDNYGQAGAVSFYGQAYHLPEAYSDNASFLYWLPEEQHIENLILVTDDQQEMQHAFIHDFRQAILVDSVANPYAREKGSLIILLKGANDSFNSMFRNKIRKDREELK